jgi:hypothetical protein
MKSIKFSEDELDFLRTQYQLELVEAEKYVQDVKTLLKKLGVPHTTKEPMSDVKIQKKRGRKPKSVEEKAEIKVVKKKRKTRSDKGGSRLKPIKPVKQKEDKKEAVLPASESELPKKVVPKKRTRKKRNFKSHRVVLAPLSKPLKRKQVEEVPPVIPALTETVIEKSEENSTL